MDMNGETPEISSVIRFLASAEASYINGSIMLADDGVFTGGNEVEIDEK